MNDDSTNTGERNHAATTAVGPLLLTVRQVAEMLSVGRTSVYEFIAAGDLETVHIGRCMRIRSDSVHRFVAVQRRRQ